MRLPTARVALRHPALRAALLLLLIGPVSIRWLGPEPHAQARLRALALGLVVAAAWVWDDRLHSLTAPTPVGLPAVRRGRALVVLVVLAAAFALGVLALPPGVEVSVWALALQTCALLAALFSAVAFVGRDGNPVLVVPLPALMSLVLLLSRLPDPVSMFHAGPSDPGWTAEQARWLGLLLISALLAAYWARDPAALSCGGEIRRRAVVNRAAPDVRQV